MYLFQKKNSINYTCVLQLANKLIQRFNVRHVLWVIIFSFQYFLQINRAIPDYIDNQTYTFFVGHPVVTGEC